MKRVWTYTTIKKIALLTSAVWYICARTPDYSKAEIPPEIPRLIQAATWGNNEIFQKLISEGVSVETPDKDNNTSLHLIVMNGNYPQNRELLKIELRLHPFMRIKSKDGLMPIHMASRIDNKEVRMRTIAQLLEFGARITDPDGKGYTILDRVVEQYEIGGVSMILDLFGQLIPQSMLQNSKKIAAYRSLLDPLDYGLISSNVQNSSDQNPSQLQNSTQRTNKKSISSADYMIANEGAKPFVIDSRTGFNALHFAIMGNNINKADYLLKLPNAAVNQPVSDEYGMRPLHLAVLQNNFDMVKLLLENKAAINATDADGNTPLHLTAHLPDNKIALQIADYLLANNAQKNSVNKYGNTWLHLLVFYNNGELIKELGRKYGLDASIKNRDREAPKDMARRFKRESILNYM